MNFDETIEKVKKNGFCAIDNFLDENDLSLFLTSTKNFISSKGENIGKFAVNNKSLFIKFLKFEYKKLYYSFRLKDIAQKYNFQSLSNKILDCDTKLINIDSYYNELSSKPVLDWHCDLSNKSMYKMGKIVNPEMVSIKFFFYLSDVFTNNGCLSYIPGSHKIVKEIGRLTFINEIDYEYYWSLEDLTKLVKKKNVRNKLENNLGHSVLEDFLINSNKILAEKKNNIFDIPMKKGGVVIFDEFGVHRGSKIEKSPRQVIRFFYQKKNIYEKFRYN